MANKSKLIKQWAALESKLNILVKSKGAKLSFSPLKEETRNFSSAIVLRPINPICIHDAPCKASSSRQGKMVLIMDGSFEIGLDDDHHYLKKPTASLTLFSLKVGAASEVTLTLVESIHFDAEDPFGSTSPKQFHPIFHAQRGQCIETDRCKSVFASAYKVDKSNVHVDEVNKAVFGTPYLRLPTPQLDLFSLIAIVAADFFCNPEDVNRDRRIDSGFSGAQSAGGPARHDRTNVLVQFRALLATIRHTDNIARAGKASVSLFERIQKADHLSAGHWYPEWQS
jgi:hypothetical protein